MSTSADYGSESNRVFEIRNPALADGRQQIRNSKSTLQRSLITDSWAAGWVVE